MPAPRAHVHTEAFLNPHTRVVASSANQEKLTWSSHLAPERFTKETLGSYTFSSLRIDREQHVPDSLFSLSNLEGNFGGNQQPDGSISLFPSPPLLPPPPQPQPQPRLQQQHTTHNTHRQRQRQRLEAKRPLVIAVETICALVTHL